jgi:septum formation protein
MYLSEKFKNHTVILASASPRRKQLLTSLDISFEVSAKDTPEDFPEDMPVLEVPTLLAQRKAQAFWEEINSQTLVIAADTIVAIENQILNKPSNALQAQDMLRRLSGKMHEVFTGVCLMTRQKTVVFSDLTKVYFKDLTDEEIHYYIERYKPYDKAGGYGAQEWLGMVAIQSIEGSYFNVMGLPVHRLYEQLLLF